MDKHSESGAPVNDAPERASSEHMRASIAVKLKKSRPARLLPSKRKRIKRDRHKRIKRIKVD